MSRLVFLDTETTGLDPDRHEVWEVAAIVRDLSLEPGDEGYETAHEWQLPVDLSKADPMALKISGFHDRYEIPWKEQNEPFWKKTDVLSEFAGEFAALTRGAHLVGAVVSFDEERLRRLLRKHGECPMWHYHLIDVEALAVGYLYGVPDMWLDVPQHEDRADLVRGAVSLPWRSDDLSRACGIEPPGDDERHTALGDARWVRDWYDAITGDAA